MSYPISLFNSITIPNDMVIIIIFSFVTTRPRVLAETKFRRTESMDRPHITIFDTTLRDGEQSPGCSMNVQEKLRLAQQLDRLGVDVIEAGFPIASDGDFEAVQRIATAIRRPIIAGLARACTPDIDRAWAAVKFAARPRIH